MTAEARVELDSSNFEAGAQKVSRASKQMAGDSAASMERVASSTKSLEEGTHRTSGRMAELAHSGRSVVDMLASGQSAMRALQTEMPRVVQALGGGVGAIIGFGAAAAVIGNVVEAYQNAKKAAEDFAKSRAFINGSSTNSGEYEKEIEQVTKARDLMREQTNTVASGIAERVRDAVAHPNIGTFLGGPLVGAAVSSMRGDKTDEQKERDAAEAGAGQQMVTLQAQKVAKMGEENALRVRASMLGEQAVKVTELDLSMRKEIEAAMFRASQTAELSADGEVSRIREAYDLKKKIAGFDEETYRQHQQLGKRVAEIETPGVTTGQGFNPADLAQFAKVKSVGKLSAEFSQALSDLQRTKDANLNTDGASKAVTDTESALAKELRAQKEVLDTATKQTGIQKLLLSGQKTASSDASARLGLETQINNELDRGQTALAGQHKIQLQQITAAQKLKAFLNPGIGAADRAEENTHNSQQRAYNLSGGLFNVQRGSGGEPVAGVDPSTNKYRETTPEERANYAKSRADGPYTGATKAREARGNNPDSIPDNPGIPDNRGIPNIQGPRNLSEQMARQRPGRSMEDEFPGYGFRVPVTDAAALPRERMRGSSGEENYNEFEKGFHKSITDIVKPNYVTRNVAEENRPKMPQKPDGENGAGALIAGMSKVVEAINNLYTKIGVAS